MSERILTKISVLGPLFGFLNRAVIVKCENNGTTGLSPVAQGALMGVGLFIGLLALILFLVCCCCKPESASRASPSLGKDKTTRAGGPECSNETIIECVIPVGPPPPPPPPPPPVAGESEVSNKRDLGWYSNSGQPLPAYAKPATSGLG
ncbi:unnamed protein product [Echinostoma caproni]|uniref:Uncharacterized protein n=1 Tax=Echinostoma caproni TaxID=27848 RepID=A0A183ACE1_9TREM|nr:unnamed protein product [Echinostoma caproni]